LTAPCESLQTEGRCCASFPPSRPTRKLNLPRHDGTEILQRLRESAEFAHIPVVVLTSSDSPRDRLVANQFGAARYLRKPSNLEEFLRLGAVFKGLLEQAKATSAG
jgi:DNA-binding response OmpR family regulator